MTTPFRVLAFQTATVEPNHVEFARTALGFFTALAERENFVLEETTDWSRLTDSDLGSYDVVVWLNHFPREDDERRAFEQYMQDGGAWLGFHVAAYNDRYTQWPWFVDFLGGAVFYTNNWPPLPALLTVDALDHPVLVGLPDQYIAPADEWYQWRPSPRLCPDVQVLVTLSPSNYPLGVKNLLTEGDLPVVWTNTKFRMVYINMGHGTPSFDADIQNTLFSNALLWLGRGVLE